MRQLYLTISSIALGLSISLALVGIAMMIYGYGNCCSAIAGSIASLWLSRETHPDRYEAKQIMALFSRVKFEADHIELGQTNNDPEFLVKPLSQQEDK